ncbi:CerR family C-terminal domain-containing protein [Rhodoferax sp. BLA1]|uniref:CerR family C-terminal domain-containing protein n=1 Tax=Rhodoferax sp. BLA1 TaxID=2576062 RepID=UPI0015D3FD5E|nr:CerR family C-terminal domain-containing protein [Rhodoferax sp. BLA1]
MKHAPDSPDNRLAGTPPPATTAVTAVRSDGIEARQRLMDAALVLFADRGFAKTSIREIALAAHANVAAISYYFGDKAGLYRAVFWDPRTNPRLANDVREGAEVDLETALQGLVRAVMAPIKLGEAMQRCMKLHFREMLEPTGLWAEEIETDIKPTHAALAAALCQHLGLTQADDDIHRLAFTLMGLGITPHVAGDAVAAIRPTLLATPEAIDVYCDRLVSYGMAMVEAEARRRQSPTAESPAVSSATSSSRQTLVAESVTPPPYLVPPSP